MIAIIFRSAKEQSHYRNQSLGAPKFVLLIVCTMSTLRRPPPLTKPVCPQVWILSGAGA